MTDHESGELHRRAIVIDGLDTSRWGSEEVYRGLREGGVTAINATVAIWDDYASALKNMTDWLGWFEEFAELIRSVRTVEDIQSAKSEGRTAVILGWQNASPIGNDLANLRLFHALGLRIVQLTYNERNLLGNGCYERSDDGLSKFGLAAVREMNRLGILIDLSHVGDRTTLEAIEHSEAPVAFTHANARSQFDHPRNKTDEAIKRLAARGGVIGANAFPMFFPQGFETSLDSYLNAVDYLVSLVGVDHVGIGTDFCMEQDRPWFEWIFSSQGTIPADHVPETPSPYRHLQGFGSPREWPRVTEGLLARGYQEADVLKILGGNWLRLFRQVWKGIA